MSRLDDYGIHIRLTAPEVKPLEKHAFVPRAYVTVPWNMICRHCDGSKDDAIHDTGGDR